MLILVLFFLIGCASVKQDISLRPHVSLFEKNCKCRVNIPIKIVSIPQTEKDKKTLGVCYGFKLAPPFFRSIHIDKDYWEGASFYQRESTVLHELAHCAWDLEHDDSMQGHHLLGLRPKTIMHPYSFYQYSFYRDEYLKELWSRNPKK